MTPPLDCTRTVNLYGRSHLQISQVRQSACDHHYLFCKLMISSMTDLSKHIHLLCNLYIIIVFLFSLISKYVQIYLFCTYIKVPSWWRKRKEKSRNAEETMDEDAHVNLLPKTKNKIIMIIIINLC